MHKFILSVIFCLFIVTTAVAVEIKDNGAESSNSIVVQNDGTSTVKQGNSIQINNTIDAKASTGNNNVSGNTNGNSTIKTGDASVTTNSTNTGNTNTFGTKPTAPATPTTTVNPTSAPQGGSSSNTNTHSSGSSNESTSASSGTQSGGIGGGDVMGLAATSGIDSLSLLSSIAGFICLIIGSALVSRREQRQ